MSDDLRTILLEQVDRLLADNSGPDALRANERGGWPAKLWSEAWELGLPTALVPEALGGAGLSWADGVAVWTVLGRHGAPIPLAQSMAAQGILGLAGIQPSAAPTALLVPGEATPWGRIADDAVGVSDGNVVMHAHAKWENSKAVISREPSDRFLGGTIAATASCPASLGRDAALLASALIHAALIAGALEAVLDMSVDYANTRKQFGRPIGGFQAVQQLLAQAAGEVAAAGVAAAHAGRSAARRGLAGAEFEIASAKVVCGEAAGKIAAIAHQVHAAMGFTDEHPLHLYTRRLWAWRDACGAERVWARRIGTAALARGGAMLWPDLTARDGRSG